MNNQKRCVELLLNKCGNPFLCDVDGKKPEDVTTDTDIKILLQTTTEKPFNEINKDEYLDKKINTSDKNKKNLNLII